MSTTPKSIRGWRRRGFVPSEGFDEVAIRRALLLVEDNPSLDQVDALTLCQHYLDDLRVAYNANALKARIDEIFKNRTI